MKTLITRTITGICFIAVMVAPFLLQENAAQPYFVALMLLCITVGTAEFLKMVKKNDSQPLRVIPILIAVTSYLSALCMNFDRADFAVILAAITILLIIAIPTIELYRKKSKAVVNCAVALFPLGWIVLPFTLLTLLFIEEPHFVLALFITIWASDTFAYCAGSLFGKRRLFERISPKKSWEGFLISLVLTAGAATSFGYIPYFSIIFPETYYWSIFALLIIIAGTFGDLVESLFKRNCQIKDSGKILPGHGGILDRFDSLLFATPVAYFFLLFITKYLS